MAVIAASARYGTAVYGVSEYGVVDISATLSGVEGTGAVGTPEPRPSEPVDSVSATGQVNTVQINLTEKVDGVQGTTAFGQIGFSNTVIIQAGVEGTGEIEEVVAGGFEIDITERIDAGVEGTSQVDTVQVNLTAKPSGVEATGSVDDGFTFSNTTLLQSVVGAFSEPSVEPQITEVIGGVFATGAVGPLTNSNSTLVNSVEATGAAGQTTETGVLFDFQAVREQYSRRRTVYIARVA